MFDIQSVIFCCSDEAIDVTLIVKSWLLSQSEETQKFLESYINDYFYECIDWIKKNGNIVVPYSLVGLVHSGLSHLVTARSKPKLTIALIYGLGANLTFECRERFAKRVGFFNNLLEV